MGCNTVMILFFLLAFMHKLIEIGIRLRINVLRSTMHISFEPNI